jgi:hypothetical protein
MTRRSIERLLWQAARLRTLATIGMARLRRTAPHSKTPTHSADMTNHTDPEPNEETMTLAAELLQRVALKPDGSAFGNSVEDIEAAELSEPEIVHLGAVRLRVIDDNPVDLAIATGAFEEGGPPTLCWHVEFFQASEQTLLPCSGQYIVLPTGVKSVSVTFYVFLSHDDLRDPAAPDWGPDAVRNEALDALGPNQALIVQVFETDDQEVDE